MNNYLQGLEISLLALTITFVALGIFILIMVMLQRLFPYKEEVEGSTPAPQTDDSLVVVSQETDENAEMAAAIAAALIYFQQKGKAGLGDALVEKRSAWWTARRNEARHGKVERQ